MKIYVVVESYCWDSLDQNYDKNVFKAFYQKEDADEFAIEFAKNSRYYDYEVVEVEIV